MKIAPYLLAAAVVLNLSSCKKSDPKPETENPATGTEVSKQDVLNDLSGSVINASYADLASKSADLYNAVSAFNASSTQSNLDAARQAWRNVRTVYEQTEGFLFGPMSVNNIDPRVDTWPIDFARLDSVLASASSPTPFTASYVDGLEESLKGFHPIEYFLFGSNGNKAPADFTARQKDFLLALSDNLKTLCTQVKADWDASTSNNYSHVFTTAGPGNTTYPTQRAAFEEVITAMADICGEVADGKMKDPFDQKDASLEESPFSKNSLIDFTNNIKSVQNMYLGKYTVDGKGLEDLIRSGNIAMDGAIKTKIAAALTALGNITVPFGQAISDGANGQRTQVQNAMNAIGDLEAYLSSDVKTYLQTITN